MCENSDRQIYFGKNFSASSISQVVDRGEIKIRES